MSDNDRYITDGEQLRVVDGDWDDEDDDTEDPKDEIASKALRRALNDTVAKEWIPYLGPEGGEGWQNGNDADDIRYQENPPGEVEPGYEHIAEDWGTESGEIRPGDKPDSDESVSLPEGGEATQRIRETFESAEDWRRATAMSEVLEDTLDAWEVSLGKADDKWAKEAAETVSILQDETGAIDLFDFRIRPPSERNEAAGAYDYTSASLEIHPEKAFHNAKRKQFYSQNKTSSGHPNATLIHELGHHLHHQHLKSAMEDSSDEEWERLRDTNVESQHIPDTVTPAEFHREVSSYAYRNPLEFVAEVWTGSLTGEEYDDWVWDVYDEFDGPTIPDVTFDYELDERYKQQQGDGLPDELESESEVVRESFIEWLSDNAVTKNWIPYEGPEGGEGWQNTEDPDDVRYQENPPGEVHPDYEEMAEGWGTESLDGLQARIEEEYSGVGVDMSYGSAFFDGVADDDLLLEDIEVDEDKRGEGIGSNVMTEIVEWADDTDTDIYLQTNQSGDTPEDDLIEWYESFGFETTDPDNYDVPNMHRQPGEKELTVEDAVDVAKDVLNVNQFYTEAESVQEFVIVLESTVDDDRFPTTEKDMELIREELGFPTEHDTDEWGRQARRESIDVDTPSRRISLDPVDTDSFGDVWDDNQNADAMQEAVIERLKNAYDSRVVGETELTLNSWERKGYDFIDNIWIAAMAFTGAEKVPNHYAKYGHSFRSDDDQIPVLTDLMRLSRAQAKAEFGETVTAYRGFKKSTLDNYAKHNDDGSVTVKPQVLESWTIDRDVAETHANRRSASDDYVVAELEVETGNVGFYGPFALGGTNKAYKELTLSRTDSYTVPADQLDNYDPEDYKMDKTEIPELPVWESNWLGEPVIQMDGITKRIEKNWIPYRGPQGGEGWQNTQDPDDIRYDVDQPPGEVAAGYDEDHWDRNHRAVSEADHELGYVSEESGPTLNVTTASEAQSLSEAGASEGASSRHMHVATWRDGDSDVTHRAFVTNFGPDMERNRTGEKPLLGERAVSADAFLRNLGFGENLPKHFLNRQQRYLAVANAPGKEVRDAPDEWKAKVDEDKAKDFAAAVMLAGNSDLHPKNVLLDEEGRFYAVDLDKSAGDFENGPRRFKRRGIQSIKWSLQQMGVSTNKAELNERAKKLAERYDTDDILDGVPNSLWSGKDRHQFKANIRNNIEAARDGRLL